MSHRRLRYRLLSTCAYSMSLLAVVTCSDPRQDLEGTFVLLDINGVAPPVIVPKDSDLGVGLRTVVTSDTLRFAPGGSGTWANGAYREPIVGGRPEDVSWTYCMRYERAAESLALAFSPCTRSEFRHHDDAVLVTEDTLIRNYYGTWRYVRR